MGLKIAGICWCLLLFIVLAGCATTGSGAVSGPPAVAPHFFGLGEDLAIQLRENLRGRGNRHPRLIMATFVNLDDLSTSSRFGRTLAEALANRLFRQGFGVEEIRKSADILVRNQEGELVLSRDAGRLAASAAADGIVAGTYALTPETVIVSARLIDAASLEVLSVADLEIERTPAINGLLWGTASESRSAVLSALER